MNQHETEIDMLLELESASDASVIDLAKIEATRSLAYEQRTANLIALYSMTGGFDGVNKVAKVVPVEILAAEIKSRLDFVI